jgi:hypothetical protein
MTERLRWLLLTHEGRVALAGIYLGIGTVTVVTYLVYRSPVYAAVQGLIIGFGLWWVTWCVRRR